MSTVSKDDFFIYLPILVQETLFNKVKNRFTTVRKDQESERSKVKLMVVNS